MLVLDAEDVSKFSKNLISSVEVLSKEDAATLYQAWEHAVRSEGLEWLYVADVYESKDGYYYFYSEKAMKSDFNVIDYISRKCTAITSDFNTLSAKALLGEGRGLPSKPLDYVEEPVQEVAKTNHYVPNAPLFPHVEGVSAYDSNFHEDDEATGLLNEDDYLPPNLTVAYELAIEGTTDKIFISSKEYTIGRSESADWRILGNKSISRFHAKIWVNEEDRLMVLDTGSSNGVFVDAVRIGSDPVDVTKSSVITFGNAKVRNLGVRQVAY